MKKIVMTKQKQKKKHNDYSCFVAKARDRLKNPTQS